MKTNTEIWEEIKAFAKRSGQDPYEVLAKHLADPGWFDRAKKLMDLHEQRGRERAKAEGRLRK